MKNILKKLVPAVCAIICSLLISNVVYGITPYSIFQGGTGASTASTALSNLGGLSADGTITGATSTAQIFTKGITSNGTSTFSGNVGIGTTDPSQKLDINGAGVVLALSGTDITGSSVLFGANGTNNAVIRYNGAISQGFEFRTATGGGLGTSSNTKMAITSTGNVGIGTTDPWAKLEVKNSAPVILIHNDAVADVPAKLQLVNVLTNSGNPAGQIDFGPATSTQWGIIKGISLATFPATTDGGLTFSTRGSGTTAERVRIDNSGNVGIGTTSPGTVLDIITNTAAAGLGGIRVRNTATSTTAAGEIMVYNNLNYRGELFKTSSNYTYRTIGANDLGFYNGGNAGNISILNDYASGNINFAAGGVSTPQMILLSTGNVGIGTTEPTSRLHLAAGTATADTAPLGFTPGVLLTSPVIGKMEMSSATTTSPFFLTTNNTTRKPIVLGNDTSTAGYLTKWDTIGNNLADGLKLGTMTDTNWCKFTTAGGIACDQAAPGGSGTVTSVSVTTANGISGSVATATTTPAITLTLGAITPSTVNGVPLSLGLTSVASNIGLGELALSSYDAEGAGFNTAVGYRSSVHVTTGEANTSVGSYALHTNVTGDNNTAIGSQCMQSVTGDSNTAVGKYAGLGLTSGGANTAVGSQALQSVTTGNSNVALGLNAGKATTGTGGVFIGASAGQYETGSNAFYVDNQERNNTAGDKAGALLYGTFNSTPASQTLKINGNLSVLTGGSTNHTVCWKTGGTLGYCSTIVGADGTCTCN